jgi:hypothetical protein
MRYLVRGEFSEESLAGRTPEESTLYFQRIIMPKVEALLGHAEKKRVVRGVTFGGLEGAFVVDADSTAEAERLFTSLPLNNAVRWSISPIESLEYAIKKHREARRASRAIVVERSAQWNPP